MVSPTVAHAAQEMDMFGNPIDWERNASGNEDNAGNELGETKVHDETYSFQEQADILQEMLMNETEAPKETGYITISLDENTLDWNQENIKVELSRGNVSEEIWLYRQTGWTARSELPVGHYTFYRARTADGAYKFSCDLNSFDISENGNVILTLNMGLEKLEVQIDEETVTASGEIGNEIDSENIERNKLFFGLVIFIFSGVFIVIRCLPRRKAGFRNDLLDKQ